MIDELREFITLKRDQQQQSGQGGNGPARSTGGERKDEPLDDKGQQHCNTKDHSQQVVNEEVP